MDCDTKRYTTQFKIYGIHNYYEENIQCIKLKENVAKHWLTYLLGKCQYNGLVQDHALVQKAQYTCETTSINRTQNTTHIIQE